MIYPLKQQITVFIMMTWNLLQNVKESLSLSWFGFIQGLTGSIPQLYFPPKKSRANNGFDLKWKKWDANKIKDDFLRFPEFILYFYFSLLNVWKPKAKGVLPKKDMFLSELIQECS